MLDLSRCKGCKTSPLDQAVEKIDTIFIPDVRKRVDVADVLDRKDVFLKNAFIYLDLIDVFTILMVHPQIDDQPDARY